VRPELVCCALRRLPMGKPPGDLRTKEEREAARKEFGAAMRQAVMEYDSAAQSGKSELNFREFSKMVRERELGVHSEVALRERFTDIDKDGSGTIDMGEFVRFAVRDALLRSTANLADIFAEWDADGSGMLDRGEFRDAIYQYGFEAEAALIDQIFDDLVKGSVDPDQLSLSDMSSRFRMELQKRTRPLQRLRDLKQRSQIVEPESAVITIDPKRPLSTQIIEVMSKQNARVMDFFRLMDTDGDGLITKKEWRQAVAALGFDAPKEAVNEAFNLLDADGGGTLEYKELVQVLQPSRAKEKAKAAAGEGGGGGAAPPEDGGAIGHEVVHLRTANPAAIKRSSAVAAAAEMVAQEAAVLRLPPIETTGGHNMVSVSSRRKPKQRVVCKPPALLPVELPSPSLQLSPHGGRASSHRQLSPAQEPPYDATFDPRRPSSTSPCRGSPPTQLLSPSLSKQPLQVHSIARLPLRRPPISQPATEAEVYLDMARRGEGLVDAHGMLRSRSTGHLG